MLSTMTIAAKSKSKSEEHETSYEDENLRLTKMEMMHSSTAIPEKSIAELCQEGLLEEIKRYQDDSKLRELDENGWSVLHYACRFNQQHIIEYLIVELGFDVNMVTNDDTTPLHLAVRHNCHEAVRCLFQHDASSSVKNNSGESAIHFAGKRGDREMATILLDRHETDIEDKEKNHRRALHYASFYGNEVTCETLLNRGADIQAKTIDGLTALHVAVISGKEEIVKLLIKRAKQKNLKMKEFVNACDNNGTTPLHLSARGGQFSILEILLRHEADVDAQRDISGRCFTALHLAAVNGDIKICKVLLNKNASLDITDCDGCTPLLRAAAANHEPVVTFLLTKGSALTSVDKKGCTSFLHAVQEGHTMLAETILRRDTTQINQRTKKARCSIHLAVMNRHKVMLMMLLKNGGAMYTNAIDDNGRTPLHCAAALGDAELTRTLLEYGSSPNTSDSHAQTPLHLGCQGNSLTCVKLLMDKSVITLNFLDDMAQMALHISCQNGSTSVVNYLLKLGADVSSSDKNGDTALHCAVRSGSLAVCCSLLDYYAPCHVENSNHETPLHEAAKGDCPSIVVLLLDKKANTTARNNKNKTFLDLAIENCNGEVLEAIMNHHCITNLLEVSTKIEAITKMVHSHPSVAIALLDRGITFSSHSRNDNDFAVTYDFKSLDPGPDAGPERFATLKSLVEHRQEEILSHPLVKKLLSRKWTMFGRNIYLFGFLLFLVFHVMLCWLAISERQRATFHGNTTTYAEDFLRHPNRNIGVMTFLFILALVNIVKEVAQVFLRGLRYFKNFENFVEIVYYGSTMLFLSPYLHVHENNSEIPELLRSGKCWQFAILAIFFGWLNFVLYLRNYMFPTLGLYITMFFEILKTFLRISSVICIFLFGYANVFYIIFPTQKTFANIGTSFMTTTVMMIGEIGYRETLIDTEDSELLPFPELSYIIFAIFVCTIAILLANLLVGLAVGDIDGVQNNANISLVGMLVDYVTEIEEKMPRVIQRRCYEATLTMKPNKKPSRKVTIFNRVLWQLTGDPCSSTHKAVDQMLKERFKKGRVQESEKLSRLETTMVAQQHSIRQLKKMIQSQTRMMQEMRESLGLRDAAGNGETVMDGYSTLYGFRSTYS